jgi:hypothetical protein
MAIFVVIDLGWLVARPALYVALAAHDRGWPAVAWIAPRTGTCSTSSRGLWIFSFPDFSAGYRATAEQLNPMFVPTGELLFTYVFRVEREVGPYEIASGICR